ncbi:MAG TPA: CPBP family intramembrane glutamic endopeptidase, partial [Dehalococcoidales bacterium]|nr:CPBP family intramembrane glutamic endopeptidase [Dehalococcoidales bacterium]
ITALAWASLHAVQYGIYTVVAILVLGVAMGYVRLLTKSIWNTLMIHMVINAVGMLGIIGLLGKQFS